MTVVLPKHTARVQLSWDEVRDVAEVGCARHIAAMQDRRQDLYGPPGLNRVEHKGWHNHIIGAGGELAVAKHLGVQWERHVNTFTRINDLGRLEIRTRLELHYGLLVRPNAKPLDPYVLVLCEDLPELFIVGWMFAKEAMQQQWRQTFNAGPPAYFVPHKELHSPDRECLLDLYHGRHPKQQRSVKT